MKIKKLKNILMKRLRLLSNVAYKYDYNTSFNFYDFLNKSGNAVLKKLVNMEPVIEVDENYHNVVTYSKSKNLLNFLETKLKWLDYNTIMYKKILNAKLLKSIKTNIELRKILQLIGKYKIQYQDCIFCKAQMIDLLSRFEEVKDPKQRAENHKKRYGIEYFSKKDVQAAINEVKRATREFFGE